MDVGREIRRIREGKGWSQTKLAAAADMGVSGISQIETGARNPSAVTLSKIADALGVGIADLFPKGQAPLPDFEDERRAPTLRGWILLTESLAERWTRDIDNQERVLVAANSAAERWALEMCEVFRDVIDGVLEDPLYPQAYSPEETDRLDLAFDKIDNLVSRTGSWFSLENAKLNTKFDELEPRRHARRHRLEQRTGRRAS